MAFKKLLFLTCLSLISPLSIQAELLTQETNIRYDIDYDINWFKKFIIRIAGYDFLDWEELNIQTTFQKNNITGEEKSYNYLFTHSNKLNKFTKESDFYFDEFLPEGQVSQWGGLVVPPNLFCRTFLTRTHWG